jgi:uncharacterized protein
MVLEGVVTNVTNFGAFVDIGVHQDGLVHISALADRFVKDPHDVVKAGDVVKVKVMEVDVKRKRIGLTMRLSDSREDRNTHGDGDQSNAQPSKNRSITSGQNNRDHNRTKGNESAKTTSNAMADAFAKARKK